MHSLEPQHLFILYPLPRIFIIMIGPLRKSPMFFFYNFNASSKMEYLNKFIEGYVQLLGLDKICEKGRCF